MSGRRPTVRALLAAASVALVCVLARPAACRSACPLYMSAYGTGQLPSPTPAVEVQYDPPSNMLSIAVTAAYDPTAALVLGFEPFSASRRSLADAGVCENRAVSEAENWAWAPGDFSACDELPQASDSDTAESTLYPLGANGWERTVRDCNTVTYTFHDTLGGFLSRCGSAFSGVRETAGRIEHYGSVFVAYVRPAVKYDESCEVRDVGGVLDSSCGKGLVYDEQQIAFYISDETTLASSNTCTGSEELDFTSSARLQWTDNAVELKVQTWMPRPTDTGLLCSMTSAYQGAADLPVTNESKECACDIHCYTSAFCTGSSMEGMCEQSWSVHASGKYYPGMLDNGKFSLTWKVNNCEGYVAGAAGCQAAPTETCTSVISISEKIQTRYEYVDPIRPYAALMVKQPPGSRFNYSFTDQDLKVWVRLSPFANSALNASALEYCEAQSGTPSCKNGWTKLQAWSSNSKQTNGPVESSITLSHPKDKIYLFRATNGANTEATSLLVLDTHNESSVRVAPMPSTYINSDRISCGSEGTSMPSDDASDGFERISPLALDLFAIFSVIIIGLVLV